MTLTTIVIIARVHQNGVFLLKNKFKKKKKQINSKVILFLAGRLGCEHAHNVKEESLRAVHRG